MNQLIVGALQESRIDRDHRLEPFGCQPGGESQRMLFGDADVEIAFGEIFGKAHEAGALAHRRGDADQFFILCSHIAQPVAEYIGVGSAFFLRLHFAAFRVERRYAVINTRVSLRPA